MAPRARDGSNGAAVGVDPDRLHVGKCGYGKSDGVGVLAEELATARGTSPLVADPVGGSTT